MSALRSGALKNIFIFGLLLFLVGIGCGAYFVNKLGVFNLIETVPIDQKKNVKADSIQRLNVKSETIDVRVLPGAGDEIAVQLHGETSKNYNLDNYILKVEPNGDVLKVEVAEKGSWKFGFFNFKNITLDVTLPNKLWKDLQIKSTTGDIEVKEMLADRILLETETGDVDVAQGAGAISIGTSTGDVNLGVKEFTQDTKVVTETGDIFIDSVTAPKALKVEAKTETGDVSSKFPMLYRTNSEHRIEGEIGSSGPLLSASSKTGDIQLGR